MAKTADFISYNAVLALAEAGHTPETDEHLDRAVKALLAAQRPEGSWEGDPVYQGFNTPFRATQFAVMALSTLYPGPLATSHDANGANENSVPPGPGQASAPQTAQSRRPEGQRYPKGWDAGFPPPPTKLATNDLPRL